MARSNADLLALKAELTNDPTELGLVAPPSIDDVGNAEKLNLVRDTIQIEREAIPATEIARSIDRVEYGAATLSDRQWIDLHLSAGLVDARTGSVFRTGMLAIFGAQTSTRANLQAILTVDGNRIEQLFRAGTLEAGGTVTPSDVANARNAT
jgi:hypothetical protein